MWTDVFVPVANSKIHCSFDWNYICECFVLRFMDSQPKYAGRFEDSVETTKTLSSHSDTDTSHILNSKTEVIESEPW